MTLGCERELLAKPSTEVRWLLVGAAVAAVLCLDSAFRPRRARFPTPGNRGPTPSVSTLPCPVAPEALTVPPHHGLGPHHLQRTPPVLPQPRQHDPEEPVRRRQLWARLAHLPHGDLLSECEVLQRQLPLRANRGPQCPNEDRKPSHHIRSIADQSRHPQDNRAGRVFRKDNFALARSAVAFADHHAVYPTFTMMNSASMSEPSFPKCVIARSLPSPAESAEFVVDRLTRIRFSGTLHDSLTLRHCDVGEE